MTRALNVQHVRDDALRLSFTREEGMTIVGFEGSLDAQTSPRVRACLSSLARSSPRVALDLRTLMAIDDAGVAVLSAAARVAQSGEWALCIVRGTEAVQQVIERCGELDQLPLVDELPDGAERFR